LVKSENHWFSRKLGEGEMKGNLKTNPGLTRVCFMQAFIGKFSWRQWGSALPGLHMLDSLLSLNFLAISGDSDFKKTKPKESTARGLMGSQFLFYSKSYIFCDLKPHGKFQNLQKHLLGEK
jgi:hypothetical protein